jgi:hypothetical protein
MDDLGALNPIRHLLTVTKTTIAFTWADELVQRFKKYKVSFTHDAKGGNVIQDADRLSASEFQMDLNESYVFTGNVCAARDAFIARRDLPITAIFCPNPSWSRITPEIVKDKLNKVKTFIKRHGDNHVLGVFSHESDFEWSLFRHACFLDDVVNIPSFKYVGVVLFCDTSTHGRWLVECQRVAKEVLVY